MFLRPKLCAYLFGNGTLDDALGVMANFDSAMDEPVMLMPGNELDVHPILWEFWGIWGMTLW